VEAKVASAGTDNPDPGFVDFARRQYGTQQSSDAGLRADALVSQTNGEVMNDAGVPYGAGDNVAYNEKSLGNGRSLVTWNPDQESAPVIPGKTMASEGWVTSRESPQDPWVSERIYVDNGASTSAPEASGTFYGVNTGGPELTAPDDLSYLLSSTRPGRFLSGVGSAFSSLPDQVQGIGMEVDRTFTDGFDRTTAWLADQMGIGGNEAPSAQSRFFQSVDQNGLGLTVGSGVTDILRGTLDPLRAAYLGDDRAMGQATGMMLIGAATSRVGGVGFKGELADSEAAVARVGGKPEWLVRVEQGNAFNAERSVVYPYNEVYINKPTSSGYYRLDSYNPSAGEIVSRKFTQLSDIQEQTALNYINEIPTKYPVGGTIANVPSSGGLAGQVLQGQYILEVPMQVRPIPQSVLDAANRAGVLIRDINGKVH